MKVLKFWVPTITLLSMLSIAVVEAYEGPASKLRKVYAEAAFSNALIEGIQIIREKETPKVCDFFGYKIDCVRRPLAPREWRSIKAQAQKKFPDAFRMLVRTQGRRALSLLFWQNAVSTTDKNFGKFLPIFVIGKPLPGYIPHAAYDGIVSETYKRNNDWANSEDKPNDDVVTNWGTGSEWYDVPEAKVAGLKPLSVSTSNFDQFLRLPKDNIGEDVFGDFREINGVVDGRGVLDFWTKYVDYTKRADLSICQEGCSIAVEMSSIADNIRSIESCRVQSVNGVAGSPEDCFTVITSGGGHTYVRVSVYINSVSGLDGIGSDEISCVVKDKSLGPEMVSAQILKQLNELNTVPNREYAFDTQTKGELIQIIITNRYSQSAFLPSMFEVSTIRIDLYKEENQVKATIATTVLVTEKNLKNQDQYSAMKDADSSRFEKGLIALMPKALSCKISRAP